MSDILLTYLVVICYTNVDYLYNYVIKVEYYVLNDVHVEDMLGQWFSGVVW